MPVINAEGTDAIMVKVDIINAGRISDIAAVMLVFCLWFYSP